MVNCAVFASGNGSNFQAIIDATKNKILPIKIKILVCDKSDAKAVERALNNGIDVLLIDYSKYSSFEIESMLVSKLKELRIEYIFLAGFLRKFTSLFVNKFKNKIINIHPSLLPKYKGLNAIEQALNNNEKEIGVSVHYVNEELDSGKIIVQEAINIENLKDKEIYDKVHELEHKLYVEAIQKVLEG